MPTEARVLVTGGAGFIGSHLVDALLATGSQVRVLDDLSTGHEANVPRGAELRVGSITDGHAVDEAVDGVDIVFQVAALRAVERSVDDPMSTDRVNVHGTLAVLDAARRAGVRRCRMRVIEQCLRRCGDLADIRGRAVDSPVAVCSEQLAGEHYTRVFNDLYGLETVSLRYFNVYGPRQRPDSRYAAVIPLFIDALDQVADRSCMATGCRVATSRTSVTQSTPRWLRQTLPPRSAAVAPTTLRVVVLTRLSTFSRSWDASLVCRRNPSSRHRGGRCASHQGRRLRRTPRSRVRVQRLIRGRSGSHGRGFPHLKRWLVCSELRPSACREQRVDLPREVVLGHSRAAREAQSVPKIASATPPPSTGQLANTGCMCIGFQAGRATISCRSNCTRTCSRRCAKLALVDRGDSEPVRRLAELRVRA